MMTESYEEKIGLQAIEALILSLKNAFITSEANGELAKTPRVWMIYIKDALKRAAFIINSRTEYPEIEDDVFVRLKASFEAAEDRIESRPTLRKLYDSLDQ